MINYKPFPVFLLDYTKSFNWDVYLNGELVVKESPQPFLDSAIIAYRRGFTGIFRTKRLASKTYDMQGLIYPVVAKCLGTGIDSPAYGKPREKKARAL